MMRTPVYFKWPGKIWLYSDPHFGDLSILKFERRQFKDIDEHNEYILDKINSRINKGDTLIFLGDLGHNWEPYIQRIKKDIYKVLILGNHDNHAMHKYTSNFDEVYNGPLFINKFMILSHEPIPVSDHFMNVHGHLHNSYLDDDHHINISAHMVEYKLTEIDDLFVKTMVYPRIKARFLDEWYADRYVFTDKERPDVMLFKDTGHIIPKSVRDDLKDKFVEGESIASKLAFFNSEDAMLVDFLSTDSVEDMINKLKKQYESWGE